MQRRKFLELLGSGAALSSPLPGCLSSLSVADHPQGDLRTMTILKSAERITTDPAAAIYNRHKVEGSKELIRHDVEVYRVTYTTRDSDGSEVVASGAVLVPKKAGPLRVMCYCRGTIIPVHWERRAPSYYDLENNQSIYENYEPSFLMATFASAGYVVVAPDGIGYGTTKNREHPYMHAASLASTSLDILQAAREFGRREHLDLDRRVFITGWSEGGLCGMALHKLIEDTCRDECPVAGSSLFAGCYSLSAMADLFCNYNENYPEFQIYYWVLRSMARVYKLNRPFDKTVVPPFAAALAKDVLAKAPENPRLGLVPEFRQAFLDDPNQEMRLALRDNDRYDWKPSAPVYLHHGTRDDIVPFYCAMMAYESMRAKSGMVTLYPYLGKDHYEPVNTYVTRSLADFSKTS